MIEKEQQTRKNIEIEQPHIREFEINTPHPSEEQNLRNINYAPGENTYLNENTNAQ
ncbi:hypothetical protein [Bacillus taeanensis]|uniref:hypothetical protein n=1 Tax=Bacillus taeanensis TaxID=273032 RepID=UPI0015F1064D|nr:hypothetical protein [Bacillus taeanensis]